MPNKYPENIMKILREKKGLEDSDTKLDKEINKMAPAKAFEEVLKWHGFYSWDKTIMTWIKGIFNVDLKEISDKLGVED